MRIRNIISLIIWLVGIHVTLGQNLLEKLENEYPNTPQYTSATFKAMRIGLGHSMETRKKGVLEVVAMTRYWNFPRPISQSFIADKMTARIGLEYAVSDRFTTGIGGSTLDGIFDLFVKYRLLRQQEEKGTMPISMTLLGMSTYRSNSFNNVNETGDFSNKLTYTAEFITARKFTRNLSLQIAPILIVRGSTTAPKDPEAQFAIGFGGRYKIGNHVAITSEYFWQLNKLESFTTFNAFSMGVNWEIGDVILQFILTNAQNFVEDTFITQTRFNFNFKDPNLNFGFNATYVIHFGKNKKRQGDQ